MRRWSKAVLALIAFGDLAAAAPHLETLPGKHMTARTIELGADVACTPAQAYRMWTTESGVKSFLAPAAQIGDVGGPYTIKFFPDEDPAGLVHGTAGAHLLAAIPDRFLAFEWVTFAGDTAKGDHAPPFAPATQRLPARLPTWVEIALDPAADGSGTHVAFHHYGFGDGELWGRSYDWFTHAWAGVLAEMTRVCRQPRD